MKVQTTLKVCSPNPHLTNRREALTKMKFDSNPVGEGRNVHQNAVGSHPSWVVHSGRKLRTMAVSSRKISMVCISFTMFHREVCWTCEVFQAPKVCQPLYPSSAPSKEVEMGGTGDRFGSRPGHQEVSRPGWWAFFFR